MNAKALSPEQAVYRLATSYIPARALYATVKLGIPDLLADGPLSLSKLAAAAGTEIRPLYSVLHAVAHFDVVTEQPDQIFALTPIGQLLRSDTEDSLRPLVIMFHEEIYEAFDRILDSVQTGHPAFNDVHGSSLFGYMSQTPEFETLFQRAMNSLQRIQNPALAEAFDFSDYSSVVDVGGGNGALLSTILRENDHLYGILFDRPQAIDAAKSGAGGPLPRCDFVAGDFFESVPKGGDLYVLKLIIHDWSDEDAVAILRNCRSAMAAGTRLVVIERLVGTPDEPLHTKIAALFMLHVTGGIERNEEEFRSLFRAAGLQLTGIKATPSDLYLMEGVRA